MDHRFREDENELPYLVVEKRDGYPKQDTNARKQRGSVIDVLKTLNLEIYEEFLIYKKLNEFLEAKDVSHIEVLDFFDEVSFLVVRKNEYITTTHEFIYFPGRLNEDRVFFDCYTTHDYSRLLINQKFNELIDSLPYEFLHCSGGYQSSYRCDVFTLPDELDLRAVFKVGPKKHRIYHIDLDTMQFEGRYFDYNTGEFR